MEYKLKELTTKITKGTTPSNIGEDFSESGVMYFRSELLGKSKYIDKSEGLLYITEEVHNKLKRSQIEKNDILFSMAGIYLGKISLVGDDDYPANTNQAVAIIRLKPNVCNLDYLYYYMTQKRFTVYVNSRTAQAAQPNINLEQIGNLKVELPSIDIQDKVANILSRYDELIANNNKRIKLLEQMAENLYKEWFVHFRFPSYENAEFEDGIPVGWKKIGISDVYDIKYGKTLPTFEIGTSGEFAVYGANGVIGYYDKFNCDNYVTLITSRGNGSGDVLRTHHKKSFITNNSFTVTPKEQYNYLKHEFTYWLMKNVNFKSVCSGAAQPQLTNNSINSLSITLPDSEIINSFCNMVGDYFALIENLLEENENLIKQRDLLLPRLMSGKLEV